MPTWQFSAFYTPFRRIQQKHKYLFGKPNLRCEQNYGVAPIASIAYNLRISQGNGINHLSSNTRYVIEVVLYCRPASWSQGVLPSLPLALSLLFSI